MYTRKHLNGWMTCVLVCFAMVLLFSLTGCSTQPSEEDGIKEGGYPFTITDDMGRTVTFETAPKKIVSLSPANTEILFALGVSGKLVGRTDYCNFPAEVSEIPSVGTFATPNIEMILSLSPELVVASDLIDEGVLSQLDSVGIKAVVLQSQSIEGVIENILEIGKIVDANEEAKGITTAMQSELNEIVELCKGAEKQRSVFIDLGDFYTAGDGSMFGDMIEKINGVNIAAGGGNPWIQLSKEEVIAKNPDVYISTFPTKEEIMGIAGFDTISAVKNQNIFAYDVVSPEGDLLQRPGPRIIDGVKLLANDVYPELFK